MAYGPGDIISSLYSWKFWVLVVVIILLISWLWVNIKKYVRPSGDADVSDDEEPVKRPVRRTRRTDYVEDEEDPPIPPIPPREMSRNRVPRTFEESEFDTDDDEEMEERYSVIHLKPGGTGIVVDNPVQYPPPVVPPAVVPVPRARNLREKKRHNELPIPLSHPDYNVELGDTIVPPYVQNHGVGIGIPMNSNLVRAKTNSIIIDTDNGIQYPTPEELANHHLYHTTKVDLTPPIPADMPDFAAIKHERWKREAECRRILESIYGVAFPKCHPDWLINDLTGNVMELDGYSESLGIAFEHMGEQHYRSDHYFNKSERAFLEMVYRDNLKVDLCDQHNPRVYLITIPYNIPFNRLEDYIRHSLEPAVQERYKRELQLKREQQQQQQQQLSHQQRRH